MPPATSLATASASIITTAGAGLIEVLGPFGTAQYAYNGLGQRVGKVVADASGTVTHALTFLYDQAGHLLGEYDGITQQPIQETVYLGDLPAAVIKNRPPPAPRYTTSTLTI